MHEKFRGIKVDPDTRILSRREVTVGDYTALHEKWVFDGVKAESLIFVSTEVASLHDKALEAMARRSSMVAPDSSVTISRGDSGFTFINFNFRA